MSIVIAIILFSVIVIFHELGHFLLAKANGIRVNEFSLGLGPTIVGFKPGETKYSIKLLPFGGACMMEGEDEASGDSRAFGNKPVWARFSVVFAGPLFNFILAFVFSTIVISNIGVTKPILNGTIENYPAAEAGLQAGDEIVKLGNYKIHFFNEIPIYVALHPGEIVDVTYKRNGEKQTVAVGQKYDEKSGAYYLGVSANPEREKLGFGQSLIYGAYNVRYWIYYTFQALKQLATGSVSFNELSGPVGIVQNVSETYSESAASDGYFYAFLNMLNWGIILSANLGVMNLLPLPALDGGRIIFFIIEAIRRKRIDPEKEGWVHGVGIVLLLLLMVAVMFNDIRKLFM